MYHDSGPPGRVVVLRAANQNIMIAGGNHTIIPSADCRRYSGGTIFWVVPFTRTGCTSNVAGGKFVTNTVYLTGLLVLGVPKMVLVEYLVIWYTI